MWKILKKLLKKNFLCWEQHNLHTKKGEEDKGYTCNFKRRQYILVICNILVYNFHREVREIISPPFFLSNKYCSSLLNHKKKSNYTFYFFILNQTVSATYRTSRPWNMFLKNKNFADYFFLTWYSYASYACFKIIDQVIWISRQNLSHTWI